MNRERRLLEYLRARVHEDACFESRSIGRDRGLSAEEIGTVAAV